MPVSGHACTVADAAKLPAEAGGEAALCGAVEGAVAARGLAPGHAIAVRVVSPSALAATIRTAGGAVLPDVHLAVSDARLTPTAVERFARAVADALAGASGR